jgi:hypothetical protein
MPSTESPGSLGRPKPTEGNTPQEVPWLALVAEKVGTLNYGVVQIVVHDSQVVQVERTERHRFEVSRRG